MPTVKMNVSIGGYGTGCKHTYILLFLYNIQLQAAGCLELADKDRLQLRR